jgi:hypothetical protein
MKATGLNEVKKIEDLSTNKQFERIAKWQSGDLSSAYLQMERLADKFHWPMAVFFIPEAPPKQPDERAFRSVSEDLMENLNPAIRFLCRKADALSRKK